MKSDKRACYVPECCNPSIKITRLASMATIHELFEIPSENQQHTLACDGYPLCQEHYGVLYRHLNPSHFTRKCKTCKRLVSDLTKMRKCPEPAVVQTFLTKNTEFTEEIRCDDRICYACYKSHLVIIKHMQNSSHSTDADLQQVIDTLKRDLPDIVHINTFDDALSYVAQFSAINVGETLLKQNALLLPDVYDSFTKKLKQVTQLCNITVGTSDMRNAATPVWLRNHLSSLLDHHMAYRCCIKKYGTLLYRHGGDLVYALNVSLGQMRNLMRQSDHPGDSDPDPVVENAECSDFQQALTKSCLTVNSKIHSCIDRLVQQDINEPLNKEEIDIDEFLNGLDPDIWKAVSLLTQPLSARAWLEP